jgi:hypothetical protein
MEAFEDQELVSMLLRTIGADGFSDELSLRAVGRLLTIPRNR